MFGRNKAVIGLDVGSSMVKAVELRPASKGYHVDACRSGPIPTDSIVDGAIIDSAAVAEAILRVFEGQKGFKSEEVCASPSGNAVIVKKITLPVMTETELDESIYWEAEQYIPFDIQNVNLDYQILGPGTGPDSRGNMDVLLVAAKKDKIGDYISVIAQAGRTAVVVDVDAFALQNAYEVNYGLDPRKVVVLLNAGASAININILQGAQSVFTRDFNANGVTTPNGSTITSYAWDFGDGTAVVTSAQPTTTHGGSAGGFTLARTYVVRLTITDSQGRTATTTQNVTVAAAGS